MSTIWTIGHSNHEVGRFLELLERHRIDYVVDVRSHPYSRFAPHFSRDAIEQVLRQTKIAYLYLGSALGGRPARDDHYDDEGHALYEEMAKEPSFTEAINRLIAGAADNRIALMCSEGHAEHCHRRLLVGKVLTERGLELCHISPDGELDTETTVRLDPSDVQPSLFGGEREAQWRSSQSVSQKRRLNTSSAA